MSKSCTLTLACLLLAACGGGDDELTAFEGVYEISEWTENQDSCDSPGESVLADQFDTMFYIKNDNFFVDFVNVKLCEDLADCQALSGDDETVHLGSFVLAEGSDSAGWTGTTSHAFSFGDEDCMGEVIDHHLTFPSEGVVHLESQTRIADPFPRDEDGFCDTDAAQESAEGKPCQKIEALDADLVGPLG